MEHLLISRITRCSSRVGNRPHPPNPHAQQPENTSLQQVPDDLNLLPVVDVDSYFQDGLLMSIRPNHGNIVTIPDWRELEHF